MKKIRSSSSWGLLLLLLLGLASATIGWDIPPTQSGTKIESARTPSKQSMTRRIENKITKSQLEIEEVGNMKIGSTPPSCAHKCYGCTPCEPAQVPATASGRSHLRVEYTNYEPEEWKCKCGPSFYSP